MRRRSLKKNTKEKKKGSKEKQEGFEEEKRKKKENMNIENTHQEEKNEFQKIQPGYFFLIDLALTQASRVSHKTRHL